MPAGFNRSTGSTEVEVREHPVWRFWRFGRVIRSFAMSGARYLVTSLVAPEQLMAQSDLLAY